MIQRPDYSFLGPLRPAPKTKPLLRIGIAPTPDFTLFSFSNLVEFLRHAADESDFSRKLYCSWSLLSHNNKPIRSSCGFEITPTEKFGDPRCFDYVVIHGGLLHSKRPVPQELYQYILDVKDAGVPLVGLCAGQFLFAELGLLDGRRCAVHFSLEEAIRTLFPKVIPVTNEPFVRDGSIISCPGGLATLNLAMELVSQHCGVSRVDKVLHYFMADKGVSSVSNSALSVDLPFPNSADARLTRAIGLMHQKNFEPMSLDEIAQKVGTTKRELTRLFNKYLKMPPGEYWRDMRLKTARWMVVNTDQSIAQIAYECGFTDSSHLIHWFKKSFGNTPTRMREIHGIIGSR